MEIAEEIQRFDSDLLFLGAQIGNLGPVDAANATDENKFFAEALAFRMFRASERLIRAIFLDSCVSNTTPHGTQVNSKLKCPSHEIAEEILKVGNKFMDWGNTKTVRDLSALVLENGFPVSEVINPMNSTLIDLQRIRNFIAHDSTEAASGFEKVTSNYLHPTPIPPSTAGALLLSRRAPPDRQVIKIFHQKISELTLIYLAL